MASFLNILWSMDFTFLQFENVKLTQNLILCVINSCLEQWSSCLETEEIKTKTFRYSQFDGVRNVLTFVIDRSEKQRNNSQRENGTSACTCNLVSHDWSHYEPHNLYDFHEKRPTVQWNSIRPADVKWYKGVNRRIRGLIDSFSKMLNVLRDKLKLLHFHPKKKYSSPLEVPFIRRRWGITAQILGSFLNYIFFTATYINPFLSVRQNKT